jgi:hypothetical protein
MQRFPGGLVFLILSLIILFHPTKFNILIGVLVKISMLVTLLEVTIEDSVSEVTNK